MSKALNTVLVSLVFLLLQSCHYETTELPLTLEVWGDGEGRVLSVPSGLDCDAGCEASFAYGTEVELRAFAEAGSAFAGFRGDDDCRDGQLTMDGVRSCSARFIVPGDPVSEPSFQVFVSILGAGQVSATPHETICDEGSEPCTYVFDPDSEVEVSAIAAEGWTWDGWEGDAVCGQGVITDDAFCVARFAMSQELTGFVSDVEAPWSNYEIYSLDLHTGESVRLSDDPAIDNHADISEYGQVVWSSDRGNGEFDLYVADIWDVEGTATRLTSDQPWRIPSPDRYADRHPHFHPDGTHILYTSKNRPHQVVENEVASECSVPIIVPEAGRYCEGLNVLTMTWGGQWVVTELDLNDADPSDLWPDPVEDICTYVGHPGFAHGSDRVVFTGAASLAGGEPGTVWEVYSVELDMDAVGGPALVPGSMLQHTDGPATGPNPIQMSGGAAWGPGDAHIYFTSTRTAEGNSLLYRIPSDAVGVSVDTLSPLYPHRGNDYMPHALHHSGQMLLVSDLGADPLCGDDAELGPTGDLDLVLLDLVTDARTVVGTEANQEMLLLGDEVSWFCGLSPNLSACRQLPRIKSAEALWLEGTQEHLPLGLIERFNYPDRARRMYAEGWKNATGVLQEAPLALESISADISELSGSGYPGLGNSEALQEWREAHAEARLRKHVVPSVMHEVGLGAPWPDCSLALDLGALPVGPILPGSDFRIDAPYGWVTVHFGSVEEMAELAAVDVAPYYELKAGDGAAFLDVSGGLVRVDNSRLACDTDHVAATLRVDGAALHAVAADPYDATVLTGSAPPAVGLQSLVMETSPEPHVERLDLWSIGTFQLKELHLE